jgi:hypothetical protein
MFRGIEISGESHCRPLVGYATPEPKESARGRLSVTVDAQGLLF